MLIKQWADGQGARHVMDDEDEYQQEPLIPQVEAAFDTTTPYESVLVLPSTIAVIVQPLEKKTIGKISVRYAQLESAESIEEFDEDEQLYAAARIDASRRKFPDVEIPLYELVGEKTAVLAAIVPHFVNPIAERAVATKIATLAPNAKTWLALSPCQLNNGKSISKLDLSPSLFANAPLLKPPHFITGISAAVVSALYKENKLENVGVLALNSEGHPGYEKVDADAIMDAATEIFSEILASNESADVVKKLSGVVRKINSSSTSGMYL